MKIEKFLKGVGTHGQILTRENGDKWLVCAGVGMKVPAGVENLLGAGEVSDKTKVLVEALVKADTDDRVELKRAYVSADGKANDIVRIFSGTNYMLEDIEVGIHNADFGLLEKGDKRLAYVEVEDEDTTKYLLILNQDKDVIGFIEGRNCESR